MSSPIPVWVPLVVAIVGVIGTFAAAVISQVLTRKRDDHRWVQEREAEHARWERERGERLEQWQREDAARWLTDRRAAYVELLVTLDEWASALWRAFRERRTAGEVGESTRTSLRELGHSANRAYQTVRLIAAPEVVRQAEKITLDFDKEGGDLMGGRDGDLDPMDALDMLATLTKAMRADLQVEGRVL